MKHVGRAMRVHVRGDTAQTWRIRCVSRHRDWAATVARQCYTTLFKYVIRTHLGHIAPGGLKQASLMIDDR
jgi:hypothetical protein